MLSGMENAGKAFGEGKDPVGCGEVVPSGGGCCGVEVGNEATGGTTMLVG